METIEQAISEMEQCGALAILAGADDGIYRIDYAKDAVRDILRRRFGTSEPTVREAALGKVLEKANRNYIPDSERVERR